MILYSHRQLNITFDGSSGEEDSSDGQDSPISGPRSHGYHDPYDDEWERLPYPDEEIKPSNATSRLRASREARNRNTIQGSRSGSGRPARRRAQGRESFSRQESFSRRSRRTPSPESPESVSSAEEYIHEMPQDRRYWPPVTQGSGFPRGSSSGPSYPYAPGAGSHGPYGRPGSSQPPSDQLIRLGHHGQVGQPAYSPSMYPYGPQFPNHSGASMSPFFQDHPGHPMHPLHHPAGPHARGRAHGSPQPFPPHGALPYGGLPMNPHELVPYGSNGYYPFRDPYAMVPEITHPSYMGAYPPRGATPNQEESRKSPDPPPADAAKDEAIARLEKLILEERTEREAREAREAAKQAEIEKEAAEQAAKEERAAHEKQIAEGAAAAAKAEAEQKASEEAAKAKQEADEAAAAAAEAAAEAATAAATEAANAAKAEAVAAAAAEATAAAEAATPEKKKPIKFKDAIGRKFSFPFELCATWQVRLSSHPRGSSVLTV